MTGKTGTRQSNRIPVLGITGGVGAGKSTILTYLKEKYNAHILEADAVGHLVQQPDMPCWEQIVSAFGADILRSDRTIDRVRLGAIVYADRAKLDELNAIVHPAVKEYICQEIAGCCRGIQDCRESDIFTGMNEPCARSALSAPLIVIEAALLLEDHYDEICDEIWYIYADERTREERLRSSRGYSREKVRQIMGNQLPEEEFRHRCQVTIDNSGTDPCEAYAQVDRALRRFWM